MRYADGPALHREVRIAADAARVWETVADIEAMAKWSPELARVEWRGGATGPAEGASYVGHNEHPTIGQWRTVAHFTEAVPGKTLTWCVLDADGRYGEANEDPGRSMATWSFTLTEDTDGVLLRQTVTLGPGRSGLTAYIEKAPEQEEAIIEFRFGELAKGMDATLQGIKEAAEQREG
ncbi:SRPBCC family protein [Streptomyces nitrosporeus]|uniref:SRPBCC family protein n=1 Tax=Streptomyces nitrosporeus TaxID=28894 RepID=A0A5J6F5L1_9ACTN|nr:SRPBCC family protein [Streptomyces nitrosporeus]QEU71306.1 SRPBCC family protein [Streptomyces nitrosporeus]GGY98915.1 cyclase [Streptomyces nitrosporeus]